MSKVYVCTVSTLILNRKTRRAPGVATTSCQHNPSPTKIVNTVHASRETVVIETNDSSDDRRSFC